MKRIQLILLISLLGHFTLPAQTNIICTDSLAQQIMLGNYTPNDFAASNAIDDPNQILCDIRSQISTDSLLAMLKHLETFHTRHTYSTTTSDSIGIGAARRWVHKQLASYGQRNENRLIPAYLQFDMIGEDCGDRTGFRNVLGILPGRDTTNHRLLIVEAHMDSRCADHCDSTCYAPGVEDNGSGTALVMEMARVMSQYTFNHTIVFMLTVGEEEGLYGAEAMTQYCMNNNIDIKGVQNNDIVGGIICGNTSSPPSCPGVNHIDSLHVRLFSNGSTTVPNRNFARTIKMWYQEKMQGIVAVPMTINIMEQEDRTGRGGDHIPFGAAGYRSLRFTSANEHGNANTADTSYSDRQHTSGDVLGVDTNGDTVIDSFYVDMNYLKRNTIINSMALTLMGLGAGSPAFSVNSSGSGVDVDIVHQPQFLEYRIGVRLVTGSNVDFNGFYATTDTNFTLPGLIAGLPYAVSIAGIDSNYVMTPFSAEQTFFNTINSPADTMAPLPYGISCTPLATPTFSSKSRSFIRLQPNPMTTQTAIQIEVEESLLNKEGRLSIINLQGQVVDERPINIQTTSSIHSYTNRLEAGIYFAVLTLEGKPIDTVKMVVLGK